MGDRSTIEWTDATWNPVSGCSKVSQACKYCYAERLFPRPYPGRKFTDVRVHPERLDQPLRWARPRRIFVNSMSDLFHEDVPFEFIDQVFAIMSATDRHTYQVLTKRPERMLEWFARLTPDPVFGMAAGPEEVTTQKCALRAGPQQNHRRGGYDNCGLDWPLRNVWLGVSVENQETAGERIPLLLQTPAAVRFLSCEPLLGPINFRWAPYVYGALAKKTYREYLEEHGQINEYEALRKISWVIVGGESGPRARPMHPEWARSLRDQCVTAGVPFFFKQWGEWKELDADKPTSTLESDDPEFSSAAARCDGFVSLEGHFVRSMHDADPDVAYRGLIRPGKKAAGRELDGRTWEEFPS